MAGSGAHQLIQAGPGGADTLISGSGYGDILSADGDNTVFQIGLKGDCTIIAGGNNDTVDLSHDSTNMAMNENITKDGITIHFTDTGQTVDIVHDKQGMTLHFSDGHMQKI